MLDLLGEESSDDSADEPGPPDGRNPRSWDREDPGGCAGRTHDDTPFLKRRRLD